MAPNNRSNPLALAVLSCLYERPMHPYEVAQTLRHRAKHESIKLNYGSLYNVVEGLEKRGFIRVTETVREGRRPERTIYEITETGSREFIDWLSALITTPCPGWMLTPTRTTRSANLTSRSPAASVLAFMHPPHEMSTSPRSLPDELKPGVRRPLAGRCQPVSGDVSWGTMATMKVITATLAAALLLTACGSSDDSGAPSATPAPTASSATPSATPTRAPTPTPKPKPAPRPTPPPKAKDGTNLAACRDADCQIQVSGRTTIKFSGGKLVITKIDKFAHFVLSGQYGGADGQLAPNAPVSFGGGGMSGTFGGSKPVPRSDDPPGLTLRVVYVGSGRAIVDLHAV